jgi:hypothetical protein
MIANEANLGKGERSHASTRLGGRQVARRGSPKRSAWVSRPRRFATEGLPNHKETLARESARTRSRVGDQLRDLPVPETLVPQQLLGGARSSRAQNALRVANLSMNEVRMRAKSAPRGHARALDSTAGVARFRGRNAGSGSSAGSYLRCALGRAERSTRKPKPRPFRACHPARFATEGLPNPKETFAHESARPQSRVTDRNRDFPIPGPFGPQHLMGGARLLGARTGSGTAKLPKNNATRRTETAPCGDVRTLDSTPRVARFRERSEGTPAESVLTLTPQRDEKRLRGMP